MKFSRIFLSCITFSCFMHSMHDQQAALPTIVVEISREDGSCSTMTQCYDLNQQQFKEMLEDDMDNKEPITQKKISFEYVDENTQSIYCKIFSHVLKAESK